MKTKLRHPIFLALHGVAILAALLLPLYMKIASWIEYEEVKDELKGSATLDSYDIEFTLISTQDVDGAAER